MANNVHQGHRARKRFGQNFLNDAGVIDAIVSAIDPSPEDNLVEIGPGLGALTEPVVEISGQLNVVELDRDLAERLQTHPFYGKKLTIHQGDALKYDFSKLRQGESKLKVFGNLPYNISTPLIFHLFDYLDEIESMHFMLQKEVVDRMVAEPGSKAFGRLSVMAQYFCQVTPVIQVPPGCFVPPPKVESAVVRLVPREQRELVTDMALLGQILADAFNQRRKTIRNSLKGHITAEQLEEIGINPGLRPEALPVSEFVRLANYLANR